MKTITIRDNEQNVFVGTLPRNWSDVPLRAFLERERTPDAERTTPRVLAMLTGIPEEILFDDVSLCVPLWGALEWFRTTLPQEPALPSFRHLGVEYQHTGNLQKLSAGQLEALSDFLREYADEPIQAASYILAVLYKPTSCARLTPEIVTQSAEAFRTLSMTIAYPAILDFTRAGASAAFSFRTYLELAPKAAQLLQTLDELSRSSGASKPFYTRWRNSLFRMWIRYARKQL